MEAIEIKTELTPLRKILSSFKPEKLLRQHAYAYITLLVLTALLIYYYSYPLHISKVNLTRVVAHKEYYKSLVDISESTVNSHTTNLVPQSSTINVYQKQLARKEYYKSLVDVGESTVNTHTTNLALHSSTENTSQKQRLVTQPNKGTAQATQGSSFQQNSIYEKNGFQMEENKDTSLQKDDYAEKYEDSATKETQNINSVTQKKELKVLIKKQDTSQQLNTTSNLKNDKIEITDESKDSFEQLSTATTTFQPASLRPSSVPTSLKPSLKPSSAPTSLKPSLKPSSAPTSLKPSIKPSSAPTSLKPSFKNSTMKTQQISHEKISTSNKNDEAPSTGNKFLVYSKNCKIPDIDPMHPSILEFVEFTGPLVCKEKINGFPSGFSADVSCCVQ